MGSREQIGLVYVNSSNWIGGTYYVQNLVKALNILEENNKPIINLYCSDENSFTEFKTITQYPYLVYKYHKNSNTNFYRFINYGLRHLLRNRYKPLGSIDLSNTSDKFLFPIQNLDLLYPKSKALSWIPDFQDKYYPEFFPKAVLKWRDDVRNNYLKNNIPIVFSSQDSLSDFEKFYSGAVEYDKKYVLHFAVCHPHFDHINVNDLWSKFNITKPYLFCANQFWIHKNHKFLFHAFSKAKQQGLDLQLVCSGKMKDFRNKDYADELDLLIDSLGIRNDVKLVGFISREEQLSLMSNSYAIVQPSLFEGWSTVVEDAKALNKFIFLSNLSVHIEQKPINVCYFDPHNVDDLTSKLLCVTPSDIASDYSINQKQFAMDFMAIINNI